MKLLRDNEICNDIDLTVLDIMKQTAMSYYMLYLVTGLKHYEYKAYDVGCQYVELKHKMECDTIELELVA